MELEERLEFIKAHDPEGMDKLKRLLDRKSYLMDKNVYGETFTERQFDLVFDPLLHSGYDRAQILKALSEKNDTVPGLAEKLNLEQSRTFDYIKDLLKRNLVEIVGFEERHPVYRKR
jgi:DNA-binding MarR family transcriptional regulator